jgi:hypothetical protein
MLRLVALISPAIIIGLPIAMELRALLLAILGRLH